LLGEKESEWKRFEVSQETGKDLNVCVCYLHLTWQIVVVNGTAHWKVQELKAVEHEEV